VSYLCNLLLPIAGRGPCKANTKHGVALNDGVDGLLDALNGDSPGHAECKALVETTGIGVFGRRLHVQFLNRGQPEWLFIVFLAGYVGPCYGGGHLGDLGEVDDGLGPEHILDGQLDLGVASPRDHPHGPNAVPACPLR
jgi:hypothetical protein